MKLALVLEGGGLRGAYTAGVCTWLLKNDIEFDVHIGISSGAMHAISFALKDENLLYGSSVTYAVDKKNIGVLAFLREGTPVGYNYMFQDILPKQLHVDPVAIRNLKPLVEYGVFDLGIQKTVWLNQKDMDDKLKILQAACTLPIAGRNVRVGDKLYMDGGVTSMIPIERADLHHPDKMIVVTTKPTGFVRKDNGPMTQFALDILYGKYKELKKAFRKRKDVYYHEVELLNRYVEEGRALHLSPSKDSGAKRFSATLEQTQMMFDLGLSDCEARKDEILAFVKKGE